MRIRHVVEANFRSNEATIWKKYVQANPERALDLKSQDVVVFVSKTGTQLLFIHGFVDLPRDPQQPSWTASMLPSQRYRLEAGTWSPFMLKNYAAAKGIVIEGLMSFEEHYRNRKGVR